MRLLTLRTILVATDLDEGSLAALTTAHGFAHAAGASVHVVHVSDDQNAADAVAAIVQKAGLTPGDASVHVAHGEPAHAINMLADKIGTDAILVGPHRNGTNDRKHLLGSTAMALVTNASVPCLVVARPLQLPLHRVVAGLELADTARGTLVVALSWASALRAHSQGDGDATVLTALHVRRSTGSRDRAEGQKDTLSEVLDQLRHDAGSWSGATIEHVETKQGDAATGVADYARTHGADLVVLGTRGLGLDNVGRLGSVAAGVMQQIDVPILLVPPAVWMAYVNTAPAS